MVQLLQEQQGNATGAEEHGLGGQGSLHRASGSGSSLGSGAPHFPAGLEAAMAAMQQSAHSGGSNGGSSSEDYNRSNGLDVDACSPTRGASGEYSASAAVGQAAAAAAATAAAEAAAAAADDPGPTPAHPRAMSRIAGMSASAAGVPAEAIAAAAADGAAGLAPQFAVAAAASTPLNGSAGGLRAAGAGGGAHQTAPASGLEALIFHPTDSAMKPIVGNKR